MKVQGGEVRAGHTLGVLSGCSDQISNTNHASSPTAPSSWQPRPQMFFSLHRQERGRRLVDRLTPRLRGIERGLLNALLTTTVLQLFQQLINNWRQCTFTARLTSYRCSFYADLLTLLLLGAAQPAKQRQVNTGTITANYTPTINTAGVAVTRV